MKMVQRKVSNKLGIKANIHLLKTDNNRQANIIKPSLRTHDGRCKTPDLMTKKMKKSRSIKRGDHEISLGSSPRQPGKPPPVGTLANTPSPMKKATPSSPPSSYGSPNYMKSTSSSEARKELKTKVAKNLLSRSSSLRRFRSLTTTPSFKHTRTGVNKCSKVVLCENHDVQRNTCSTTLKDSKFPPYLKLNPGATEAQGTSVMKVCPYNYCSLNGHHHKPAPPLRCFLSSRRKLLKTQKMAKPEMLSPCKEKIVEPKGDHNEDFFIEICVPGEDAEEDPLTPEKYQISHDFSHNEEYEGGKPASVSLDESFGETSDMEWEEGQTKISDQEDDGCDHEKPEFNLEDKETSFFEDFIIEKLKSYFDEDIMEWEWFSDADSVPDSEPTQPDEEQIEDPSEVEKEGTKHSGQKDETTMDEATISANPDIQSTEAQNTFFFKYFDEIIQAESEGRESDQESVETQGYEAADNSTHGGYKQEYNGDFSMEERISTDEIVEIVEIVEEILPKIEDLEGAKEETPLANNDSEVEVNPNEDNEYMITCSARYKERNEDCIEAIEAPEIEDLSKIEEPEVLTIVKDDEPHSKDNKFFNGGSDSGQELLESCNKLKGWIRCKKENDDNEEEDREFNPRDPNFLPLEPDPESEKVDLRHQDMDERRNSEEWMLDYALQKTVNQLAPARKKKVALLVAAFEAVLPIPKYETRMRKNTSGFANARTLQACN